MAHQPCIAPTPSQAWSTFLFGAIHPGRDLGDRPDVLSFISEPLERDTELNGQIVARLFLSSSTPDTNVTLKLIDVHPPNGGHPGGFAMNLAHGILRTRYRNSFAQPQPLEPGHIHGIEITAVPTCNLFTRGHRISPEPFSAYIRHDPFHRRTMMNLSHSALLAMACLLVAAPVTANAQTARAVPSAGVARDMPEAQETPDPKATYKIVFDVETMAGSGDAISPALTSIGSLINTYTRYGVPLDHLQMTAVFHGKTIALVLRDEVYRQRMGSPANPNAALLRELMAAGVHMVTCGQSALAQHYTPADYLPGVQTNLSATVTFLNLQTKGYVKIAE